MRDISRRSFIVGGAATALSLGALGLFGNRPVANADTHQMDTETNWIWANGSLAERNNYAEFITTFDCINQNSIISLEIACDHIYAVYVNDDITCFAQCSDFGSKAQYENEYYKLYDKVDISNKCNKGQNKLRIIVWHNPGVSNCQTFLDAPAGVIFQIFENKNIIKRSNSDITSRIMNKFYNGEDKDQNLCWPITGQLGFGFFYDMNINDNDLKPSTVVNKPKTFHQREILPCELGEVTDQLEYKYNEDTKSILVKMPEETVGFLDFKIYNPTHQILRFSYGEHTCDKDGNISNHVRETVGGRKFYVKVKAEAGIIEYMNPLRRLGAKYIEIFVESADGKPTVPLKVEDITSVKGHVGLRPVMYPLEVKDSPIKGDARLQEVYDACILTLRCSMHEHYEDCPWREQCLYGMDSRNQMLCGYYAFEGHEYQRQNLILLANSLRHSTQGNSIIEICSPCNNNFPIPMFSFAFILGVAEYLEHTQDFSILKEVEKQIDAIFASAKSHIDETGLLKGFGEGAWNFYEWWSGNRSDEGTELTHDTNLNAMVIIAHEAYKQQTGKTYLDVDSMRKAIDKNLLDGEYYQLGMKGEVDKHGNPRFGDKTSQLVNAMAIMAGTPKANTLEFAKKLVEDMKQKRTDPTYKGLEKASLSMKGFIYDAILQFKDDNGKPAFQDEVYEDIMFCYGKMLDAPYFSGTVWEDEDGQAAFDNAGSLCHGWSALPIYYIWEFFYK